MNLLPDDLLRGPPVPEAYRGLWRRTLLETPQGRDTSTVVHWLQTERWHADVRVPEGVRPDTPEGRARMQGFCGLTHVSVGEGRRPDVCTWHRLWDVQPPALSPDAGHMVFETPDRLIEAGVHGAYLEVWERVPGTAGPFAVSLAPAWPASPHVPSRFTAGRVSMLVRPRLAAWPADVVPGETLHAVVSRHPAQAHALLDFDLSLVWHDER